MNGLEVGETFETLVAPGVPLPAPIGRLTGLSDEQLRRAPRIATALRRFSAFAGDAVLVAHNARFDVGFVNAELERLDRQAALGDRDRHRARSRATCCAGGRERTSLASLAFFFGTSVEPCHRALPDAQATAEVFVRLLGLAQERGATTVSELEELAAPRPRRVHGKRRLAHGAPERPGVYLFRDRHDQVLYVGKARDLRARLRSYFQTHKQRSPVEVALDAVERIEWRVLGSELAAALEEVRLIRELRPPANARKPQPERYVYLRRRGEEVVVSRLPSAYGPLRRRAHAERAARALGMLLAGGVRRPARGRAARAAVRAPRRSRRLPALRGRRPAARPDRVARARDRPARAARAAAPAGGVRPRARRRAGDVRRVLRRRRAASSRATSFPHAGARRRTGARGPRRRARGPHTSRTTSTSCS